MKMKKIIIYSAVAITLAVMITGCSENAWNNHLDGFQDGFNYTEKITVDYTLTNSDYEAIGKALEKIASSDEEKNAAKAIQTNRYFDESSVYPAKIAIPYLLDNTSSEFFIYSEGSEVDVTYKQVYSTPEELSKISSSSTYTLTNLNYQEVWGSESDYVPSFSPSHPAASYLPAILKENYPEAEESTYAIVSYNNATENPVFGDTGEVEITDKIKNVSVGEVLSAVAVVSAQCTRGLILTDNGGSILYYNTNIDLSAYPVGTIVKVSGEVGSYGRAFQLTDAASIEIVGSEEYSYPSPTPYSASMIDAACAGEGDFLAEYVSITGEMSISGNYYNIVINGANSQGSLYYATDEIKNMLENGKSYILDGYFVSVSSGKYFNMVVTDVKPVIKIELTNNIKGLSVGDEITATAIVTGQCTRGLILTDNGGSVLYYNTSIDLSQYPIGTAVKVSGTISSYGRAFQLTDAAEIEILGLAAYTYPEPINYTASMIDEACAGEGDFQAVYVSIQGQMSISGSYYNVNIEGATSQGSLYYATDEIKEKLESGSNYILVGYYVSVSSGKYFNMVVTDVLPVVSAASLGYGNTRSALMTPSSVKENAVYYFNGNAWVPAEGVVVINPEDYTAMGFDNNNLSDADIYIPLYLKANYPYAISGDEIFVAYNLKENKCSTDLFIFDGQKWNLNNNGLETLTSAFIKKNGTWSFLKTLGKAIFDFFDEDELELDRTYLLTYGDVCANPVGASKNYDYLLSTSVTVSGNQIVMANENNGFKFLSSFIREDKVIKVPEGYFVIQDSNERFMYLQGSYSSFNVSDQPGLNADGSIVEGYLFSASNNGDGTWTITNNRGEGNIRNIYYSTKYSNFAGYTEESISSEDHLPSLYLLEL